MKKAIRLGAVLYDPKVSVIWEIICEFFESRSVPMDVSFYSTYEQQVDALVDRKVDIAWNSPLAWLDTQHRSGNTFHAVAMRDTDCDRVTHFVVRRESGFQRLEDLRGRDVAMGASDSPQATLIPMEQLARKGLDAGRDYTVRRFDVLVGKHGDHIGGELDAFRSLQRGEAAASCMLDLNWKTWTQDGTVNPDEFETLARTERFDHCVFAVSPELPVEIIKPWLNALFSMNYGNPKHREMMDMEGLKAWVPGRTTGFDMLTAAVLRTGFFEVGGR
jgi:ABC-type phosphate/phosphonate transport system substrate-binding protein